MADKKGRNAKLSEKQKKVLVEFIKNNPNVRSGKQKNNFTNKDAEREWRNISGVLNSMPGAQKTWTMWKKTWHDLQSRTKTKNAGNRKQAQLTGGGPSQEDPLTTTEDEILDIIKKVSVEGHEVSESVVSFTFPPSNENAPQNASPPTPLEEYPDTSQQESQLLQNLLEEESEPVAEPSTEENTVLSVIKSVKKKQLPKKISHLINAATASTCFKENLQKKTNLKENYYREKIEHLKRMEEIENRKVAALEKIAAALTAVDG